MLNRLQMAQKLMVSICVISFRYVNQIQLVYQLCKSYLLDYIKNVFTINSNPLTLYKF